MKLPTASHAWEMSPSDAIALQKKLAAQIKSGPLKKPVRFIAGLDAAFTDSGKSCIGAVVLWDVKTRTVVETATAKSTVRFPYIPGLLSFRESESLLAALSKLTKRPDLLMCDGQGIAHPRRLGIASHLSLLTNLPALGCGKSRLVGEHETPGLKPGDKTMLTHKGEVIGSVLRTKTNTKPVFVSIGNRIDLETAEQLVLQSLNGYRLPEPTRLADKLVAREKTAIAERKALIGK